MLRQVLYPIDSKWVEWGDCLRFIKETVVFS